MPAPPRDPSLVTHTGGCHCGKVRFELDAPADLRAVECNCSICRRVGYLHLFTTPSRFRVLQGQADLVEYTFGTGTARHLFCPTCGVKAFYVPRSHPDGFSVNARCLEPGTVVSIHVEPFDGANWEQNAGSLDPLPE